MQLFLLFTAFKNEVSLYSGSKCLLWNLFNMIPHFQEPNDNAIHVNYSPTKLTNMVQLLSIQIWEAITP